MKCYIHREGARETTAPANRSEHRRRIQNQPLRKSKDSQVGQFLGCCSVAPNPCFNVATHSTCIYNCDRTSWCLPCSTGKQSWTPTLLLLMMHAMQCSTCISNHRTICWLLPSSSDKLLLTEPGLLPLQLCMVASNSAVLEYFGCSPGWFPPPHFCLDSLTGCLSGGCLPFG